VLSNLGLSYVLSKDLPKAEEVLRRAYEHAGSDPRVRANLAVVVGLQGRMSEAETLMKAGLPAEQAQANIAELKRLLSRTARAQRGVEKLPVARRATPD
jgi:Flp pilus assembly protein TadD